VVPIRVLDTWRGWKGCPFPHYMPGKCKWRIALIKQKPGGNFVVAKMESER
jgi:hypothetical protein